MTPYVLLIAGTAALVALSIARKHVRERKAAALLEESVSAGLIEPPSLHPVIDPVMCIGCGGCIEACPEKTVLGLIDGVAVLTEPTSCIGHGACKTACPSDAIRLVFGTASRGVDLPVVGPDFQTDLAGIYVAGELGGMGLIRNAVEQGRQAVEEIRRRAGTGTGHDLDLVIVGAGPAGLSASLAAHQHGLRFVTVDQDNLGGTIAHYPRGKIVMTRPATLPVVGKIPFRETTKEALMEFWTSVTDRVDLPLHLGHRVEDVVADGDRWIVVAGDQRFRTRTVLLAIGRRGTPRTLGVPGEDLPKVVYRLGDPAEYRGRRVLVVGGGDSAIEAAVTLSEEPGTDVTLSYRSAAFSRARAKNRDRLQARVDAGRVRVMLESTVDEIAPERVRIRVADTTRDLPNDAVLVCAGGILPTGFLKSIGIDVRTHHGEA